MGRSFDVSRTRLSVFHALLRGRNVVGGKAPALEDHDRKILSFDDLIRASFALGGKIKAFTTPKERVGVLLPSGVGCAVTFFALQAIGRVPAMLNFSSGPLNVRGACEAAGLKTVLTAQRFIDMGGYQNLVQALEAAGLRVVMLEDVRKSLSLADKLGAAAAAMAPHVSSARLDPDETAAILFTSGSFGAPRGVALSHANLVANVDQCYWLIDWEKEWAFFNPLPMFHAFGLTAGTLLPLFHGHKVFLYPSPLHYKEIPKLIQETQAKVLLATDTFAHHYARACKSNELSSLVFAVLGAERVHAETREMFDRQGVTLLEGYGATECSPVLAVNIPQANKFGTVGRILPGVEVRLEPVPGVPVGDRLIVRGPNVMQGYLTGDSPNGLEPPVEGWHDTGDVGSIDAEGFLTIHGRVKRFAKIAGEMVSLAAVETYAAAVWPENRHAAVAIPCARKGERVVLLTDKADAKADEIQAWAQANGAPEIAVPKRIVHLEAIPVLGSGKVDYGAAQKEAERACAGFSEAA